MSPATDSAGQPFQGRSFEPNPFHSDTGEADPALASALEKFQASLSGNDGTAVDGAFAEVVHAVRGARLLVPLIAEAGEMGLTEEGRIVEKTQELSIVHVEGPDGRAVAPFFSSVSAMSLWRPEARPVPVEAARAALASAAEGLALMVLDPGSSSSVMLRRGAIHAIATGERYVAPERDPAVLEALAATLEPYAETVVSHRVHSGDPARRLSGPEIVVELALVPGLDAQALTEVLAEISAAWSASPILQARVDGLGAKVVSA